jgi:hypothetical protein
MSRELTEEEKAQAFVDLVFDDENTKQVFMRRFYSIKDEKIYEKMSSKIPKFIKNKENGFDLTE